MAPLLPPVFRHGAPARRNRHTRKRAAWAATVEKGRPRGRPGGKAPILPPAKARRFTETAHGNCSGKVPFRKEWRRLFSWAGHGERAAASCGSSAVSAMGERKPVRIDIR